GRVLTQRLPESLFDLAEQLVGRLTLVSAHPDRERPVAQQLQDSVLTRHVGSHLVDCQRWHPPAQVSDRLGARTLFGGRSFGRDSDIEAVIVGPWFQRPGIRLAPVLLRPQSFDRLGEEVGEAGPDGALETPQT